MRPIDADSLIDLVQDSTILGDGFKQAFIAIVKGEPTINPHEWIPISEKLPRDNSKVLACINGIDTGKFVSFKLAPVIAEYYSDGWLIEDHESMENFAVLAWMPLPEPYKKKEADKCHIELQ